MWKKFTTVTTANRMNFCIPIEFYVWKYKHVYMIMDRWDSGHVQLSDESWCD